MFGFFPWKNDPIWLINIFQFGLVQPPISWGFPFENKLPRFFFSRGNPALPYPKTGRDWRYSMPTVPWAMGRWEGGKMGRCDGLIGIK